MIKGEFSEAIVEAQARHPNIVVTITVYDKPKDFPEQFVARMSYATAKRTVKSKVFYVGPTETDVIGAIPADSFCRVVRNERLDPTIVAVWI